MLQEQFTRFCCSIVTKKDLCGSSWKFLCVDVCRPESFDILSSSHHFDRMYFLTFSPASHPACGSSSRVYLWSGSPLFPLPRTLTCIHVAGERTLVSVFGWNWSSVWYKPFYCHLRLTCSLATWAISWIFPVYSTWRKPIESVIINISRFKDKSVCCNSYLAFLYLAF